MLAVVLVSELAFEVRVVMLTPTKVTVRRRDFTSVLRFPTVRRKEVTGIVRFLTVKRTDFTGVMRFQTARWKDFTGVVRFQTVRLHWRVEVSDCQTSLAW